MPCSLLLRFVPGRSSPQFWFLFSLGPSIPRDWGLLRTSVSVVTQTKTRWILTPASSTRGFRRILKVVTDFFFVSLSDLRKRWVIVQQCPVVQRPQAIRFGRGNLFANCAFPGISFCQSRQEHGYLLGCCCTLCDFCSYIDFF